MYYCCFFYPSLSLYLQAVTPYRLIKIRFIWYSIIIFKGTTMWGKQVFFIIVFLLTIFFVNRNTSFEYLCIYQLPYLIVEWTPKEYNGRKTFIGPLTAFKSFFVLEKELCKTCYQFRETHSSRKKEFAFEC